MAAFDPLLACLGLPHDDPGVQGLLRRYAITRIPAVEQDAFNDPPGVEISSPQDWLSNHLRGIEFGFEDEAAFTGNLPDEWGLGPMLLTQIYLYVDHPESAAFEDALPFGLQHDDDRASARARMDPLADERRSRDLDTWALDRLMITAGYLENDALSFVLLLCAPPAPDSVDNMDCPGPEQFTTALGHPVNDDQVRRVLKPLGYPRRFQRLDTSRAIMDLRHDLGAYLEFDLSNNSPVLSRVLLLGDRRFGSAVWPGDLPGGLRFGAGWSEVLDRSGRPPDSETEDNFILYADWRVRDHVIRIEYATMTNEVLALSILLPGD